MGFDSGAADSSVSALGPVGRGGLKGNEVMVVDLNKARQEGGDRQAWRLPESEFVMYDEDEDEEGGEFGGDEGFEEDDEFGEDDDEFLEDEEELEGEEEFDDDDDEDL